MDYGNDDSMLSLSALDGFLTAVLSGPELVSPSQWWPALWGGIPPRVVVRAGDETGAGPYHRPYEYSGPFPLLSARALYPCVDGQSFRRNQEICNAEEWCFGYLRGMALGNWPALPEELDTWLEVIRLHGSDDQLPLLASLSLPEHQQSVAEVGPAALKLHAYFLAQRGPNRGACRGTIGETGQGPCQGRAQRAMSLWQRQEVQAVLFALIRCSACGHPPSVRVTARRMASIGCIASP